MGFVDKILKPTPFYKLYKKFIHKKLEREQRLLEEKLHPIRNAFYKKFIAPGDLVFDVGANVGNRVASFLACGARVVAVEPQPACVAILQEKFANKITIENIGLAEQTGELELQLSTDSTVASFNPDYIKSTKDRFKYSEWTGTLKVRVTTLDELIKNYGVPRFCKIDVEGFELSVLRGLHHPVPFLSLEYCVPEMELQLVDCIKRIHEISPVGLYNYSIGESMEWAFKNWMNYNEFIAHIATPTFVKTSFGDIYFKLS